MFLVGVFFVCVLFLFCVCVKFSARESYESIVGDYQIKVTCYSIVDNVTHFRDLYKEMTIKNVFLLLFVYILMSCKQK